VFSIRTLVVSAVVCFASAVWAAAEPVVPRNVRGMDPWASEALQRGLERSALVQELVATLEASDAIVHVQTLPVMPVAVAGMTRLVAGAGDDTHRYIRISLARELLPNERAATLAHELQHAREIAESTARSDAGVVALYHRIGRRVTAGKGYFETTEAQRAGARAWVELRTGRAQVRTTASQER
jgi:hypothetical protein